MLLAAMKTSLFYGTYCKIQIAKECVRGCLVIFERGLE